jgi:hypothetical protein
MSLATDRRVSRRYKMALPLQIRPLGPEGNAEIQPPRAVHTHDVGHRGFYFLTEGGFRTGMALDVILTMPREVTLAGDVHIRCYAHIVRVDSTESGIGVAARIDRYEILPGPM